MSRTQGQSIPKYRKHRASGQAVCTINGRDHYLGPHNTKASKLEYDRLIAEWLAAGRSPAYGEPTTSLSVMELVAGYVAHAKKYYGDSQRGSYANILIAMRPLKSLYGQTPAIEFGVLQFKAIREKLATQDLRRVHPD